tara:strand:- start:611 stop:733 length:123 start_codon:yes stop_codon:yes gene_type:complete
MYEGDAEGQSDRKKKDRNTGERERNRGEDTERTRISGAPF